MILCLAYVVDDGLKALLVVDIECASTLSPPFLVGARQLVRQDGGAGGPFYGAQPLQPTQTRAPTGERLQIFSSISIK